MCLDSGSNLLVALSEPASPRGNNEGGKFRYRGNTKEHYSKDMGSIDPGHNSVGVEGSEQERRSTRSKQKGGGYLFRFRKLPRGLDQRGQGSQRLSGLEEGML